MFRVTQAYLKATGKDKVKNFASFFKLVFIFYAFVFYGFSSVAQQSSWWNKSWEYRLPAVLNETMEIDRDREPIVLTGKMILDKSNGQNIHPSSIRVTDEKGKEIPVQIEKNGESGVLKPGDKIVFQAAVPANSKRTYYVYFSKKKKEVPHYNSSMQVVSAKHSNRTPYAMLMSNSCTIKQEDSTKKMNFEIGVTGTNALSKPRDKWKNYKEGAICYLSINNIPMISPAIGSVGLPVRNPNNGPWGEPKLIVDGPVRKIVEIKEQQKSDKKWNKHTYHYNTDLVSAQASHRYILYANSPLIGFKEIYDYERANKSLFMCWYVFKFSPGGYVFDTNDILYCLENEVVSGIPFTKVVDMHFEGDKCKRRIIDIVKCYGNWFAWVDPVKKSGLGVFTREKGLIRSTINGNHTLNTTWSTVQNSILCTPPNKAVGKRFEMEFAFLPMVDEDGEYVNTVYGAWSNPVEIEIKDLEKVK